MAIGMQPWRWFPSGGFAIVRDFRKTAPLEKFSARQATDHSRWSIDYESRVANRLAKDDEERRLVYLVLREATKP